MNYQNLKDPVARLAIDFGWEILPQEKVVNGHNGEEWQRGDRYFPFEGDDVAASLCESPSGGEYLIWKTLPVCRNGRSSKKYGVIAFL